MGILHITYKQTSNAIKHKLDWMFLQIPYLVASWCNADRRGRFADKILVHNLNDWYLQGAERIDIDEVRYILVPRQAIQGGEQV